MERDAFARALHVLRNHPLATWSAIAASVLSAVFFLILVVVLALFADLMINRGSIPAYQHMPAGRTLFDDWLAHEDKADNRLQRLAPLQKQAADFGLGERWTSLIAANPQKLPAGEKEKRRQLIWMLRLPDLVADGVNAEAGDSVRASLKEQFQTRETLAVLHRDLADFGILSLVVRTNSSLRGWPPALLAGWGSWTWANGNAAYLQGLFLLALVIAVLRTGLLFLADYLGAWATVQAVTSLRRLVYHHTFRLGSLAFRAQGPSEAVSVATRQIETVHQSLFTWLTVFFREPVKFVLLLLFAMFVNFWLAVAFLLFAVFVWAVGGQIATFFRGRARDAGHRAADELAKLQESMMMMRLVKVYLMEQFNQARLERQLRLFAEAELERYRAESAYRPVFTLLGFLAALTLLLVTGFVVLNGYLGVASGCVLAAVLVCLYWPLVNFLVARRTMKRGRAAAVEVFDFLSRKGSVGQMVGAEFLPALSKGLELENVHFAEPGEKRKLLNGVNMTIRAGQRVALVGPDDMEKHALVYLLPRFLDPTAGEIRIDRKNIRWVTLDSLRAQIAVVLQHNMVFTDTVANNIACGDPSYSLPRVIEAAKVAHAHQFIHKLPRGYETVIGEQGHAISKQEMFLIALARAILRDPALLVIEEPHEPMTDDMKALVDDTYARVLPGRTAIFLAHRLSTIRGCDTVFLLFQGKIEDYGDHRDLLARNDLYRHLQYLEFSEFANVSLSPLPPPDGALPSPARVS